MMDLPILKGLQADYDALTNRDSGILYLTTDTNKIYLGDALMADHSANDGDIFIEDVSFDVTTQKFTFTYSDASTKEVDLVLESVLSSVSYDGTSHKLTLTLVSGTTSEIDLSDLVDAYSPENSDTISTTITSGVIKSEVIISADTGNILKNQNGLFVGEQDLSIGSF